MSCTCESSDKSNPISWRCDGSFRRAVTVGFDTVAVVFGAIAVVFGAVSVVDETVTALLEFVTVVLAL